MYEGETRNVDDDAIVADLLKAGYVEEIGKPAEAVEVKPQNGRTKKTATATEE